MAKDLNSILAGKRSSKKAPPAIDGTNLYQWNAKDGVNFIKKHEIETHDYPHDAEAAFKGKKGGVTKTTNYKFQSPDVYEETEEELDEISKSLAGRYAKSSSRSALSHLSGMEEVGRSPERKSLERKLDQRVKGHSLAIDKLTGKAKVPANEEVEIHEAERGVKHAVRFSYDDPSGKGRATQNITLHAPSKEHATRYATSDAEKRGRKNVKIERVRPLGESVEIDEKYMGFHALKGELSKRGAETPGALAAWIGRKKYGKEKFQGAAAAGKKLGEASCNHTMEGVMCEVHGESACPTKENDVNVKQAAKQDPKGRKYLADKKCMESVEYIEEKLTAKDPVSSWIRDFTHSDNPKFSGKSTKERREMALGAYYAAKKGRSVKESGSATNTDYTGPGAAGWTTGRHDMGTL